MSETGTVLRATSGDWQGEPPLNPSLRYTLGLSLFLDLDLLFLLQFKPQSGLNGWRPALNGHITSSLPTSHLCQPSPSH